MKRVSPAPRLRRHALLAALLLQPLLTPPPAFSAPPPAGPDAPDGPCGSGSPLLILGSYHMDNPGLDAVKRSIDDVLGERRQGEIESVVAALARFRPTRIAIEGAFKDSEWPERYVAWRAGERELGRNEIEQIGFRLAGRLGHETVYPIDYPMWMNGWAAAEIDYSQVGRGAIASDDDEGDEAEPELSEEDLLLRRSTVGGYLRHLNDPERIRSDHAGYMDLLMPEAGQVGLYSRSDLLGNWYKRNLRMFANLNRVARFGEDRVLLLVGAGHLAILGDLARSSPQWCLEDVRQYLP